MKPRWKYPLKMCSCGPSKPKRDNLHYAKSGEAKVRVEVFLKKAPHTQVQATLPCDTCWRLSAVGSVSRRKRGRGGGSESEVMCPLDNCISSSTAARAALDGKTDGRRKRRENDQYTTLRKKAKKKHFQK